MGKRSINTTKSGKFMNPTDQARKEARRRELKKNKKQRLLVRQTVLKGKDPTTIFAELEKIDQMEFNPVQSAPLSEKVLKEKRKKLRDTLNRIMRLYEKEEPTQWTQIKAMEVQYEKRRAELIIYCESVKHTQTVNLEEIPLPNLDSSASSSSLLPAPPGILKKISNYGMFRKPPGVPSVPPPEIYDIWDEGDGASVEPGIPGIDDEEEDLPPYHTYYQFIRPPLVEDIALPKDDDEDIADKDYEDDEEDDDDDSNEDEEAANKPTTAPAVEPPRPTTLQQRMLAIAGQDVNTVIQEMDYLHRQKEMNRQVTFETRKARMEAGDFDDDMDTTTNKYPPHMAPPQQQFPRPPMMPSSYPMGPPPPSMYGGFVPPPMPGSRLPPGPPPRMPQGLTPRQIRPPGMPPPPPPGLRPPSMLSGRPQLSGANAPSKPASSKPTASIIEAKPQMRNLSADLTRFVPTTLKVKKDVPVKKDVAKSMGINPHIEWRTPQVQVAAPSRAPMAPQPPVKTKDDAYSQFMKEMQGFM